ncbi:MAG TPA: DUF1460 domain-containing protein [Dissulfurispiraceae bacterium]|nr:DUF1460 domain-containing protein [Dissulfurispiraceae bacterium]
MVAKRELIKTGKWTVEALDELIQRAASINDIGERVAFFSDFFLGTPYIENTLIGDATSEEVFVVNLVGVDCFTFLDYVEAMRLSDSFESFKSSLKKVRYRGGIISFAHRNHFFTEWHEYNKEFVSDITEEIGLDHSVLVRKKLNQKNDGTVFVPGIDPAEREIRVIPSTAICDKIYDRLRTGDYIGIYSDLSGLDVSHVGIFVKQKDGPILRHASSSMSVRKVVDQDFIRYVRNKPGIIVVRPKPLG